MAQFVYCVIFKYLLIVTRRQVVCFITINGNAILCRNTIIYSSRESEILTQEHIDFGLRKVTLV